MRLPFYLENAWGRGPDRDERQHPVRDSLFPLYSDPSIYATHCHTDVVLLRL